MVLNTEQRQAVIDSAKAGTAWAGAGAANTVPPDPTVLGLTLPNFAAALAAIYTILLISEWIYRRVFRLRELRRGVIRDQRHDDDAQQ